MKPPPPSEIDGRLEEIERSIREIADTNADQARISLMDEITPEHYRLGKGTPASPVVGATPFNIAQGVMDGIIDAASLASSLYGTPAHSTHADVDPGTGTKLARALHDHGDNQGPAATALALSYSGSLLTGVSRIDTPGGTIMTGVISYVGALVSSIVISKLGKTITITPTYTGSQITSIARTVV